MQIVQNRFLRNALNGFGSLTRTKTLVFFQKTKLKYIALQTKKKYLHCTLVLTFWLIVTKFNVLNEVEKRKQFKTKLIK